MKLFFNVLFITIIFNVQSQGKYWVAFDNKSLSTFTIDKPEEFLNNKVLDRRNKFNIEIDKTDLPVCKTYTDQIEALGVEIQNSSSWLNGSVIIIDDSLTTVAVSDLNFIVDIVRLGNKPKSLNHKFDIKTNNVSDETQEGDYGFSFNQINMLEGTFLHNKDFRGKGIEIAIMDNGFPDVDKNKYYEKAFLDGRIKKGWDFVNNNDTLYDNENGNHGNYVISTMVSDVKGEIIGTAPDATYYLFSTEDNSNEGIAEEINWAMAAEMADGLLGTNAIISTSLGYSNGYNNGTNHTYEEMDGNTTLITIAADLAAKKGILVVNSAGNSGNNAWHYITAPSDGDSVLCIGAVDSLEVITGFSSRGPSADGDVKPNVCAQGLAALGVSVNETLQRISGTSFSCPITSGMAACLWQAFPEKSNMEIFKAIEKSAHLYDNYNDDYGYGIPNFKLAYLILLSLDIENEKLVVFPNPVDDVLNIMFKYDSDEQIDIKFINSAGKIIKKSTFQRNYTSDFYFIDVSQLLDGVYYIEFKYGKKIIQSKIFKK